MGEQGRLRAVLFKDTNKPEFTRRPARGSGVLGAQRQRHTNAATNLLFYPIDFSSSVSLQWEVKLSGEVERVQLLTGRRELIVLSWEKTAHTLDISNGAILQTISLSFPLISYSLSSAAFVTTWMKTTPIIII